MNNLAGKKVFILDGSVFYRQAIARELESHNALVMTDASSDKALLDIIHWHPDLLITGVEVGTISGYDLCFILKMMPDYAGLPVILISSGKADEVIHKAAAVGADHYLPKDESLLKRIVQCTEEIFHVESRDSLSKRKKRPVHKVMVVDDSRIMRRVITNILSSLHITEVIEAEHGRDAIQKLETTPMDLIVTDWNMPVMTGIEMIKTLRKNPDFSQVPIVMVTTASCANEVEEARAAGANGHLSKPFSVQAMLATLSELAVLEACP